MKPSKRHNRQKELPFLHAWSVLALLAASLVAFGPAGEPGPGVHGRPKTQSRPALSGPTLTYDTPHFLIHYTLAGDDAIDPADADGSGVADFVEAVAEAFETSWQHQVERLGWRPPLPDEGEGGDTRLDVYLENQHQLFGDSDLFGYMESYGGFVGDNPATPAVEEGAAYGYLSLSHDTNPENFTEELSALDSMRTTAAHELHHAIQSAYDDGDSHEWLYEASSTWIEDEVYPDIGAARDFLVDYMDAPDICPLSVGRDDQDVRWYGAWILLRYISEHHGGPDTIRRLWEEMVTQDGLAALEMVLAEQKTGLAEVILNFSVANLAKSNCPANSPYCYKHGGDYLRPYVESSIRLEAGETKTLVPKDGVQQLAADIIRLKAAGPLLLDFRGSTVGEWQVRLVGLSGEQVAVIPLASPGPTRVDPSAFERLYLVVVNTETVNSENDCGYRNYTLALADAALEPAEVIPPALPPNPGPYVPPVYGVKETEGDPGAGEPITAEEVPFPLLYPGYLPPGYSPAGITRYTAADLGDWASDYILDDDETITLEYDGPAKDLYLSIYHSPAAGRTTEDWVNGRDYDKNDIRLVNDTPVHLVDYSQPGDPFSVATWVQQDLLVVAEGTFDAIEIQQVAAGLLARSP